MHRKMRFVLTEKEPIISVKKPCKSSHNPLNIRYEAAFFNRMQPTEFAVLMAYIM